MKPKLRKAYASLRQQHPQATASTLLTWARENVRPVINWKDGRDGMPRAQWSVDGFEVHIRIGCDDYGTVDWLGEFHERQVTGAIRVPAPAGYRSDAHGCIWYVPATTYAEHYKGLRALNFGRAESDALARDYVKRDADRLRRYANGDLCLLVVGATVFRAGVELASSGLHGIDVDSTSDPYLTEVAHEMANEALAEARKKLAQLCAQA